MRGAGRRALPVSLGLVLLILGEAAPQACPAQCSCSGSAVDCHGLALRSVPRSIPRNTERLDLNGNNITRITKTDFAGLRHLRVLQLMENKISTIERGAFQDLKELERLEAAKYRVISQMSRSTWISKTFLLKNKSQKASSVYTPSNPPSLPPPSFLSLEDCIRRCDITRGPCCITLKEPESHTRPRCLLF